VYRNEPASTVHRLAVSDAEYQDVSIQRANETTEVSAGHAGGRRYEYCRSGVDRGVVTHFNEWRCRGRWSCLLGLNELPQLWPRSACSAIRKKRGFQHGPRSDTISSQARDSLELIYVHLKPRLHDTTCCQTGCTTGWQRVVSCKRGITVSLWLVPPYHACWLVLRLLCGNVPLCKRAVELGNQRYDHSTKTAIICGRSGYYDRGAEYVLNNVIQDGSGLYWMNLNRAGIYTRSYLMQTSSRNLGWIGKPRSKAMVVMDS